jgi:hypothetical protein
MTGIEAVKAKLAVEQCDRCVPSKAGPLGMEIRKGGQGVEVAVIVPEPTVKDLADKRLFRDAGGNLFRAFARIDVDRIAYLPVQGCQGSSEYCRSHLEAQLHSLGNLRLVLLVGKAGMDAWRPDQTLTKQAGKVGRMLDKWYCMPVLNPESCKRGYADKKELGRQMESAWAMLDGELPWEFHKMWECPVGKCTLDAEEWDADGVGYCKKHWRTNGGVWKKWRKEWTRMKVLGTQPRLSL